MELFALFWQHCFGNIILYNVYVYGIHVMFINDPYSVIIHNQLSFDALQKCYQLKYFEHKK